MANSPVADVQALLASTTTKPELPLFCSCQDAIIYAFDERLQKSDESHFIEAVVYPEPSSMSESEKEEVLFLRGLVGLGKLACMGLMECENERATTLPRKNSQFEPQTKGGIAPASNIMPNTIIKTKLHKAGLQPFGPLVFAILFPDDADDSLVKTALKILVAAFEFSAGPVSTLLSKATASHPYMTFMRSNCFQAVDAFRHSMNSSMPFIVTPMAPLSQFSSGCFLQAAQIISKAVETEGGVGACLYLHDEVIASSLDPLITSFISTWLESASSVPSAQKRPSVEVYHKGQWCTLEDLTIQLIHLVVLVPVPTLGQNAHPSHFFSHRSFFINRVSNLSSNLRNLPPTAFAPSDSDQNESKIAVWSSATFSLRGTDPTHPTYTDADFSSSINTLHGCINTNGQGHVNDWANQVITIDDDGISFGRKFGPLEIYFFKPRADIMELFSIEDEARTSAAEQFAIQFF